MTEQDNFSQAEIEEAAQLIQQNPQLMNAINSPQPEEKQGIFRVFNKILDALDNTKSANLIEDEIEAVRYLLRGSSYCDEQGLDEVAGYLRTKAQIVLAPTLSRNGFFIKALITQKRESMAITKEKKGGKKKWLEKKEEKVE